MTFPTQRLTITPPEYFLLRPGLETLANGLAGAKLGLFPYRHPLHRIDMVASDVYRNQVFDVDMSIRVISVRRKLLNLSSPRKVRLDVFDLAFAALALRLFKSHPTSPCQPSVGDQIEHLQKKHERYRKRAKRALIARIGLTAYQTHAHCWSGFEAWLRYNTTYVKASPLHHSWQTKLWREQRRHLAQIINALLAERLYEVLNEEQMARIVTLATASIRRGRLRVTLPTLLKSPEPYADRLFYFIEKRIKLTLLPSAPLPLWRQIADRGDRFREFAETRRVATVITPPPTPQTTIMAEDLTQQTVPVPAIPPVNCCAERGITVSDEELCEALATWFQKDVTSGFARATLEQAQYLINHDLLEPFRRVTTATTIKSLIEELRPAEHPQLAEEPTNEYAAWILGCLLAVRSDRSAIYDGVTFAFGRAVATQGEKYNVK